MNIIIKNAIVLLCLLSAFSVVGNNLQLKGKVKIESVENGVATLSFEMSWDNSWRDSYNWDAVWVFLKYKTEGEDWQHMKLQASGHEVGSGYAYMTGGKKGAMTSLFVYRTASGAGTSTVTCKLKWLTSYTAEELKTKVYIKAQGIETVYIPYGAYALGDGLSHKRLGNTAGEPLLVADENQAGVNIQGEGAVNLSPDYPRGYEGFFVMKYELSQEQYVVFLNTLTLAQQKELLPGVEALQAGEYIFGEKDRPTNRNGIVVAKMSDGTSPFIFDNNLNQNTKYGEDGDGKCVACNYMCVQDMLAYCSWSGLRPMSELEYEKACRRPYPERPVAGEYAWNDASAPKGVTALNASTSGTRTEMPGDAGDVNANFNGLLAGDPGPVRCGAFAAKKAGQVTAGATYWGVMEMSGNLGELCGNVRNTTLDKALHGNGTYSLSRWTTDASKFGIRGGGFCSADTVLRVSDRSLAGGVANLNIRGNSVGFRGVYCLDGTVVIVDPKVLSAEGKTGICSGVPFTVSGDEATLNDDSKLPFSYVWFKKNSSGVFEVIPDETGSALNFRSGVVNTGTTKLTQVFKRKAICALGAAETPEFSLNILNPTVNLTPGVTIVDACDNGMPVTASSVMTDVTPEFSWLYGGKIIGSDSIYRPQRAHFTEASNTVVCRANLEGCIQEMNLEVEVPAITTVASTGVTAANCGKVVAKDSRDGQSYCTVLIPGINGRADQCWFGKNMDIGIRVDGSDYNTHTAAGIQKICYDNKEVNCGQYGGLYNWNEAVNGEKANAIKYVSGSTTLIQGICPDGWHVPSDDEFKLLELNLGMTQTEVDKTNAWRGTDQGTKMKMSGIFKNVANADVNWCTGSLCNASGFNGLPGGYRNLSSGSFINVGNGTNWWSSTAYDGTSAWVRHLSYIQASVYRNNYNNTYGFRVRCVKDPIQIDPKALSVAGKTTVCSGSPLVISGEKATLNDASPLPFTYSWFKKSGGGAFELIPDETGSTLTFPDGLENTGTTKLTQVFKRKATCVLGAAETPELSLTVINPKINLTRDSTFIDACDHGLAVTASSVITDVTPKFKWIYGGKAIDSVAIYEPMRSHFTDVFNTVVCQSDVAGCIREAELTVEVPAIETMASAGVTMSNCGKVVVEDARGGSQFYCTVLMPGADGRADQCWFGKNINVGTRVDGADYNTHTTAGIQKICYADNVANCDKYGGLYSWDEAVNGENANAIKYVSGSTTIIQGICPDGWHVPSDDEFKALELNLGMTQAEADKTNAWRGTDQGTRMKMPGVFKDAANADVNWCAGSLCNTGGFNGLPGGWRNSGGGIVSYLGSSTYWWSSTPSGNLALTHALDSAYSTVYRYMNTRSGGFSVRCLRN